MNNFHDSRGTMPASMKDITFKEIIELIDRLKRENNADYRVMLFTARGTVIGDILPCVKENAMIKYSDDPSNFKLDISAIFDIMQEEFKAGDEYAYTYSDAYMINIVNAVLLKQDSFDEYMNLEQIILFTDQIIGFTLIEKATLDKLLESKRRSSF